jgi:hypothetical protein
LRERGFGAAYERALEPEYGAAMASLTAQEWFPVEIAMAHYAACDRLRLDPNVIAEIGADSGRALNASVLGVALRMSQAAAVTPWMVLAHTDRMRERLWRGGAIGVFKQGPKEARIEWVGQPCAGSEYYALAFEKFLEGSIQIFCRAVYVRIDPRWCAPTTLGYRVSWV